MILLQNRHALVTGKLPRDAEFRVAGKKNSHFCSFSVAADEYTDEDGQKQTTWVSVDAAFELADAARNLKKGDRVLVCGKLEPRTYTNRDGIEKTVQELKADYLAPLAPKRSLSDLAAAFPGTVKDGVDNAFAEYDGDGDGELPF